MTLDEYQQQALKTVLWSGDDFQDLVHFVLGLSGESGEIAEKLKKIIRDKNGVVSEEDKLEISKEIGDVLWHLAVLAHQVGVSFDDIAAQNVAKLKSRQKRGTLGGNGDNR